MIRDGIFRKAEASETGGCVEVAADQTGIHVRDSKRRDGGEVEVSDQAWQEFITAIKRGEVPA